MASINVRKESGCLYIDFRYRNVRCREQTELRDTPKNRSRLQALLDRIEAEILLGQFDYAATFPNSSRVKVIQRLDSKYQENDDVPLFRSFCQTWLDEMSVQWRDSYKKTVNGIVFKRLIPEFGELRINLISREKLLSFRANLASLKKPSGKNLSPSHVNRHMKLLRAILTEASDRFGFDNPFRGIKPLKIRKSDIYPFSPNEINLILDTVRDDFRDYFLIRFFTGLRSGEIDGLKWQYVDLVNRKIYVRETIVDGKMTYTKNDSSQRDVDMSEPVREAFFNMMHRTENSEFVFTNLNGRPLEHNAVRKRVWYPLLARLGLAKRTLYQTRHTAATLWLASGESPEWIAKQLGHSNTEMLFRVYSRFIPNLVRQDGRLANDWFSQIRNEK